MRPVMKRIWLDCMAWNTGPCICPAGGLHRDTTSGPDVCRGFFGCIISPVPTGTGYGNGPFNRHRCNRKQGGLPYTPWGRLRVTCSTGECSPNAAFVHAPGAGNKKEGHEGRAVSYAQNGFAYLVLDIRGNGGETPGYPLDFEKDFTLYQAGGFPEYYDTVCDMINAGSILTSRYGVPVYASGESNGGRYAAVATATDPGFAGYIGISTSGFGRAGENPRFTESARKYLLSIDPDVYIGEISPRPIILFHAPDDTVIPFGDGRKLYDLAKEPKKFFSFNGTHGVNGETDQVLIPEYTQIYG